LSTPTSVEALSNNPNPHSATLPVEWFDSPLFAKRRPTFRAKLYKKVATPPPFAVNSVAFTLLMASVLVVLSFTDLSLPSLNPVFEAWFSGQLATDVWANPVTTITVQLAFSVFMGALLGPLLGGLGVLLASVTGLFLLPLSPHHFTLAFLTTPGFYYHVGMLIAAVTAGRLGFWAYANPPKTSWFYGVALHPSLWKVPIYAALLVLMVHAIGLLGLYCLTYWDDSLANGFRPWAEALTLNRLAYDLLFSVVLMALVRPTRALLWAVLYP